LTLNPVLVLYILPSATKDYLLFNKLLSTTFCTILWFQ